MEKTNFDVQTIGINADFDTVFDFYADPRNLPLWTNAFSEADDTSATMVTPKGSLKIRMENVISKASGVVDTYMTMPDGFVARALSRIMENEPGKSCILSFVLFAPPVPLEELEGTFEEQKKILWEELLKLKGILEGK